MLFEFEKAFVDGSHLAFRTGYGDELAILKVVRAGSRSDDGGKSQLAAHDRGVAGAPSLVRNNRLYSFKIRLPVGIRFFGDEYFPFVTRCAMS